MKRHATLVVIALLSSIPVFAQDPPADMNPAVFCEGRYALCIKAPCTPIVTRDKSTGEYSVTEANCQCDMEIGWSMGPGRLRHAEADEGLQRADVRDLDLLQLLQQDEPHADLQQQSVGVVLRLTLRHRRERSEQSDLHLPDHPGRHLDDSRRRVQAVRLRQHLVGRVPEGRRVREQTFLQLPDAARREACSESAGEGLPDDATA